MKAQPPKRIMGRHGQVAEGVVLAERAVEGSVPQWDVRPGLLGIVQSRRDQRETIRAEVVPHIVEVPARAAGRAVSAAASEHVEICVSFWDEGDPAAIPGPAHGTRAGYAREWK